MLPRQNSQNRFRCLLGQVKRLLVGLVALLPLTLFAEETRQAAGLVEFLSGKNPNESRWLRNWRVTVGGWIEGGITVNPDNPGDRFNGTVSFNDRNSEFQLDQLYFFVERATNLQGESFDFGGRLDFLYGTDAAFTQAYGDPDGHWDRHLIGNDLRFYQLAIPQAYLDMVIPVGKGLGLKIGHFYTIVGNETVMAPDNFFQSHTYLMQYGEPFTHTGILSFYSPVESVTLNAGAITGSLYGGWDGVFDRDLNHWGFLGGATWTGDGATVSGTLTHAGSSGVSDTWNLASAVVHYDLTARLHYTGQMDYGWVNAAAAASNAEWYGTAQYLLFDLEENLTMGLRGEWFRDDDGFRVLSRSRIANHPAAGGSGHLEPIPALGASGNLTGNSYHAITAGLRWTPAPWATLRPSIRYDWSNPINMYDCSGGRSAPVCKMDGQMTLGADVILMF